MATHSSILGEFHGQRSLAGYNPWGHKESVGHNRATERKVRNGGVCLAGGRESGAEGLYGADTKKRNACKGVGAQRQEWAAPAHGHHHHLPPPTSVHMAAVLDPALPASSPPPFLPHPLLPTHPPFLISHSPLDSHDFWSVCSLTASKPSRPPLLVGITDT